MKRVAVVGASGFVGSAVVEALQRRGCEVIRVKAPRLASATDAHSDEAISAVIGSLKGSAAVINAAGVADAVGDGSAMEAANAGVPDVVGQAAEQLGIRFVHVSSAAVQGDIACLSSSSEMRPFSPYSKSKALGEESVLALRGRGAETVIYRPPGVHHPSRRVTRSLVALASSPAASVAGRGDAPTAQALLENVADAVAFLALCDDMPPAIVHHPSEGLTTASLLKALGDRTPVRIPAPVARALVGALRQAGRVRPGLIGQARRAEMLWFGQRQAPSWLEESGWLPVLPPDHWRVIGHAIRTEENPGHA